MRRIITALAVGGVLAGGVFGAAATLGGLNSPSLGADDAVVLSCDSNGVNVSYSTTYSSLAPAGYKVNSLNVTGIDDDCMGLSVSATLTQGGNSIGSGQGPVIAGAADNNAANIAVGGPGGSPLAESVDDLHLAIANLAAPPPPPPAP